MADNQVENTRRFRLDSWIVGVIGVIVIYMIWIGVSNKPIPEWVYWITTVL